MLDYPIKYTDEHIDIIVENQAQMRRDIELLSKKLYHLAEKVRIMAKREEDVK